MAPATKRLNTMAALFRAFRSDSIKSASTRPRRSILILDDKDYSMMWPDGVDKLRFHWKPGSIVVPPEMWWHQHFNAGAVPARHLALRWGSRNTIFISRETRT
jgi:hypothetical protein